MKLTAQLENETHALDIKREGSHLIANLDGRTLELTVREPEPGVYLLICDGSVYECRVTREGAQPGLSSVHIGNHDYALTVLDPKRLRAGASTGAQADGTARIVAPMPGKVVRLLVEQGAMVEAGEGLVVVEAMKMQNEMKSPRAGRVTELPVKAGATVNIGDVLAVIE